MRVIDRIVGSRLDPEIADRLHHLDHHHAVDILAIDSADLARRRLRATTTGGDEIAIALPRDEILFDGAVLVLDPDRAVVVRVGGGSASASIIVSMRCLAAAASGAISSASGRFFQYFFGMCPCIAASFRRAGLKMLA